MSAKKAGPRRLDPESFAPGVWAPRGTDLRYLVCERRILRGAMKTELVRPDPKDRAKDFVARSFEWFHHPVAIEFSSSLKIWWGVKDDSQEWDCFTVEECGMTRRTAQIALAEAWRTVNLTYDHPTLSAHVTNDPEAVMSGKHKLSLAYIALAIDWIKMKGMTAAQKADRLTSQGLPITTAQVRKFAEKRGL